MAPTLVVVWAQGRQKAFTLPKGKVMRVGCPPKELFTVNEGTTVVDCGYPNPKKEAEALTISCVFGASRVYTLAAAMRLIANTKMTIIYPAGCEPTLAAASDAEMLSKGLPVQFTGNPEFHEDNADAVPYFEYLEAPFTRATELLVNKHPALLDTCLSALVQVPLHSDPALGPYGTVMDPVTGKIYVLPATRGQYVFTHRGEMAEIHVVAEIGQLSKPFVKTNTAQNVRYSDSWSAVALDAQPTELAVNFKNSYLHWCLPMPIEPLDVPSTSSEPGTSENASSGEDTPKVEKRPKRGRKPKAQAGELASKLAKLE